MATKSVKSDVSNNKKPSDVKQKSKQEIAADVFLHLTQPDTTEPKTTERVSGLDGEVTDIFRQALIHRDKLINFFVRYTWVFSIFVAFIVIGQAVVRAAIPGKESVELIPYWALNLLVVGLVGQFITLLQIVTKKVWLFEAFFKHADAHHEHDHKTNGSKQNNKD